MPATSANPVVPHPTPTYAPDQVLAAQLQAGTAALRVGLKGSLLLRQAPLTRDVVRSAQSVETGSVSIDLPDLWGHGSAYAEVAFQSLSAGEAETDLGSAVYLNLELHERPLRLGVEARRYVSFFPLRANIDLARARELGAIQYSSPPTTEPIWNDTQFEAFNTCVLGGRARLDVEVSRRRSVFAWVGRQDTWAELGANEGCQRSNDRKNEVWDLATGFELGSANGLSRREWMVGVRFDAPAEPLTAPGGDVTRVFYREQYLRYDLIEWLTGPYSLQLQGWHRRRHQTIGGPKDPWLRGQALASLMWAELGSTGVGFEYDANPALPSTYLNVTVQYQLERLGSLSLFAGQRLGGLRCVSGVCRVFAPFEGARLDFTLRL